MFCRTCRGPAPDGRARCYQCDLALSQAGGLLADFVAPAGYAIRGERLAMDLWRYKTNRPDAAECAARLRESLAGFLREHADAVWRAAGMPAGPLAVAVVPTGQGRTGRHPLIDIARSCLALPLIPLEVNPRTAHFRGITADWLRVGAPVSGADIAVIDDTWVSGGSAQSAAIALKLAGARRVAVIVLGRYINPDDPRSARFVAGLLEPEAGPRPRRAADAGPDRPVTGMAGESPG